MKQTRLKTTLETVNGKFRFNNGAELAEYFKQFPDSTFEVNIQLISGSDVSKIRAFYYAAVAGPLKNFLFSYGMVYTIEEVHDFLMRNNRLCYETKTLPNGRNVSFFAGDKGLTTVTDWSNLIESSVLMCAEVGLVLDFDAKV